ncbi:hypothetical protein ACJMK2_020190, partial [Sinanodonta woodiana]
MEKGVDDESLKTTFAVSDGSDTKMKTGIKTTNIETYGCQVLPSESDSFKITLKDASDAMMQNKSSFQQSSHESEESGNSDNPFADNRNSEDPSTKDKQLLQSKEGKEVATDESKSITQRMTENEKTYSQSNHQNETSDSQSKVKIMGDSDESKSSNGHSQPFQVCTISESSGNHDLSLISDGSGNRKETESVDIKERDSSVESDDKFDVTSANLGSDLPRIRPELGPATTGEGSRGISSKWTLWAPDDLGLNGSHTIDHRRRSDGHAYDCALQPPLSG